MARDQYPSDEARRKVRPHVKIHLTVASHRRTADVWSDLESRAMLVELWRLAAEAFAGKTGDTVCLSPAALRSVTGRERHFTGVSRLATLCSRVGYEIRTDGSATLVTIRNFAKKQGFGSADRVATPRTPPPSDSDSDSDLKNLPSVDAEAASPPKDSPLLNLLSKLPGDRAEKAAFLAETGPQIEVDAATGTRSVPSLTVAYYRRYLAGDRRWKDASTFAALKADAARARDDPAPEISAEANAAVRRFMDQATRRIGKPT